MLFGVHGQFSAPQTCSHPPGASLQPLAKENQCLLVWPIQERLIVRETSFHPQGIDADAKIHELYALMTQDQARNALIVDDVIAALEEGRSPIVLTERREHLDLLAESLRNAAKNLVVLHGGMSAKERRETAERLSAISRNEERLMLATGRYIGEGFDDPRLDTLFLTMPVSWKGTLIQYSGRLHRTQSGKTEVRIYDYLDGQVPMLAKMFERRLRGYRAMGYGRDDELDRTEDEDQELTIEWDEETLRHFENESG